MHAAEGICATIFFATFGDLDVPEGMVKNSGTWLALFLIYRAHALPAQLLFSNPSIPYPQALKNLSRETLLDHAPHIV